MKKIYVILAAALTTACTANKVDGPAEWETETITVADSSDYSHVSVNIQLPLANDSAMTAMRNTLISIAAGDLRSNYNNNEDFIAQSKMTYKPFEGDTTDAKAVITHGIGQLMSIFDAMSKYTAEEEARLQKEEERVKKLKAQTDSVIDPEDTLVCSYPAPGEHWTYEEKGVLTDTTATYATFCFSGYCENSTAAHPYSSCGAGDITLRRSDGKWITKFFVDGAEDKMQPLLLAGMVRYFRDDCEDKSVNEKNVRSTMQLCDVHGNPVKNIPLPTIWRPVPKKDGLCLIYAQYEVASYAAGMPAFIIPYEDVMPYLTPEAQELLRQ